MTALVDIICSAGITVFIYLFSNDLTKECNFPLYFGIKMSMVFFALLVFKRALLLVMTLCCLPQEKYWKCSGIFFLIEWPLLVILTIFVTVNFKTKKDCKPE